MKHVFSGLVALMMISAVSTVFAVDGTTNVTTTVKLALSVANDQNLAFGTLLVGGGNKVVAVTDAAASKFTVTGDSSASISISYSAPATLARSVGGNPTPVTYTPDVKGFATDVPASATALTAAAQTKALSASAGKYFVYVGGTLTDSPTLAAGSYSGTFTLSVVYN